MKSLLGLSLASVLVLALTTPMRAQESTKNSVKEARWEGVVIRVSLDHSTLDIREVNGKIEKTIHFDSGTAWNSQFHGSKTVNKIDASQVKEGDRVICVGAYDEKNEFHATTISKRMSHSPH